MVAGAAATRIHLARWLKIFWLNLLHVITMATGTQQDLMVLMDRIQLLETVVTAQQQSLAQHQAQSQASADALQQSLTTSAQAAQQTAMS